MAQETQTLDHADLDNSFNTHAHKTASKIVAIIFVAVIVVTTVLTAFGYKAWSSMGENRTLAKYPETSVSAVLNRRYFEKINAWVSDHQAFKAPLVAFNSFINLFLFGAAFDGKTVIGKDGWYFYGFESMQDDFTRESKIENDPNYLRSLLIYLEELYYYGQKTDKQVLFMVAPNKHNVYPQYYSSRYKFGRTPGTAKKIEAWLGAQYPSMVAPIADELITASRAGKVYYKTDTHWNYWGAKLAVDQLKRSIKVHSPEVTVFDNDEYIARERVLRTGNFAKLLGLPLTENSTTPTPIKGWKAKVDKDTESKLFKNFLKKSARKFAVMQHKEDGKGKFMMIGDSFMSNMIPYSADAFAHSLFLNPWGFPNETKYRFPQNLIKEFDPDVLVVSAVERRFVPCRRTSANNCSANINGDLPTNIRQMRLKEKFEEAIIVAKNILPQKVKDQERHFIKFSSNKEKIPDGRIAIAKISFPQGMEGSINAFHKKLPLEVRNEQTQVRIKPNQNSAYLVLNIGGSRHISSVTIEGENIDPSKLKFEVRHFEDKADPEKFKNIIEEASNIKLSSLQSELQN